MSKFQKCILGLLGDKFSVYTFRSHPYTYFTFKRAWADRLRMSGMITARTILPQTLASFCPDLVIVLPCMDSSNRLH